MALTGYFYGYDKTPEKRYVNTGRILWVTKDRNNPDHTNIKFNDQYVMVVEHSVEAVVKYLNN